MSLTHKQRVASIKYGLDENKTNTAILTVSGPIRLGKAQIILYSPDFIIQNIFGSQTKILDGMPEELIELVKRRSHGIFIDVIQSEGNSVTIKYDKHG